MIDSYSFGKMIINGNKYTSDLITYQDDVIKSKWWRNNGHELCVEDIRQEIDEFKPTILIVGTGKYGVMKILPETEQYLKSKNINLIVQTTDIAFSTYNKLLQSEKILGAFHLTC